MVVVLYVALAIVTLCVPLAGAIGYTCGKRKTGKIFFGRLSRSKRRVVNQKEVYDNLVTYFTNEKPFLDPALSVSDVARHLCTNRTYISEAVNVFARMSFPSFVNSYRVSYSINIFKENPDMKVGEIALRSGFNSASAYNAQFKLVMNISPGVWFRKNRAKLKRMK